MGVEKVYDSLIIGGGAAGLNAALGLGRVGRSCIVFSTEKHRNHGVDHVHAVLGSDHVQPDELYARGRHEIARYGNTEFVDTQVMEVLSEETTQFVARNAEGTAWRGRTIILATGVEDILPELPGYIENWPTNIYQCLFCDGWERRDLSKGILCYPGFSSFMAQVATTAHFMASAKSSPDKPSMKGQRSMVTVYTNGPPNPSEDPDLAKALETLAAHRIHVDTRKVVKLTPDTENIGVHVHLQDPAGTISTQTVGFLFNNPPTKLAAPHLFAQLGIDLESDRARVQPPFQSTNVDGVFVAGDAATQMTHVTNAIFMGMMCAAGAAHYCDRLDDRLALENVS